MSAYFLRSLTDTGAIALFPLQFSISAPPSVEHLLMRRSDGSYHLLLWSEAPASEPVVPTQTVTVTTATRFASVAQSEYEDDGEFSAKSPVRGAGGTITLTVTDRISDLRLQN